MRAWLVLVLVPFTAMAGPREREVGGPARDLYVRHRPASGHAPQLTQELRDRLAKTEQRVDAKRLEAIGALRALLATSPSDDIKADGLFKLADLVWEEARRTYLRDMDAYTVGLATCARQGCAATPVEPKIDLAAAEKLYVELHDTQPKFRRMDLVTYLIGFAENEAGRHDAALERFREVVTRFPTSPVAGDAWTMIGEHRYRLADFTGALDAYRKVTARDATYDFALFKRAWCEWKLNDLPAAAADFKRVIETTKRSPLRGEAIDYLVVLFTEDRSVSANEVVQFIGAMDPAYGNDILGRVADSYTSQGEWARSTETLRFMIGRAPRALPAADLQRRIVGNWIAALDDDRVQVEIEKLLGDHGPGSAWARAQTDRDALARSLAATEQLVRDTALRLHAEAQNREKTLRRPVPDGCLTRPDLPADLLASYQRTVAAYDRYLTAFASPELRYHRADILCFKLARPEDAGDAYFAIGKTAPVGPWHKDALYAAISAYEKARLLPGATAAANDLLPVDKKLGEAMDLYATLFKDAALAPLLFKRGQLYFDRQIYGEAVKRFAVVVRTYPDSPDAAAAADRILSALAQAGRHDELVGWARELRTSKWFAARDERVRLTGILAGALGKSADALAAAGQLDRAATRYLEQRANARDPAVAAQALMNAGVMYERAKNLERATATYTELATTYTGTIAEAGAFAAAHVNENAIRYDQAAQAYELVTTRFAASPRAADALFNAGVLRQALGQHARAIAHYTAFAKRYPKHASAADVAFNIAVVYAEHGDHGAAFDAFTAYAARYSQRSTEAHVRAGRAAIEAGQLGRARDQLATARRLAKTAGDKVWAAEARYREGEIVLGEFKRVKLDTDSAQFGSALARKAKLLDDAEKLFGSVLDFGDPRWSIAAMMRDGEIYDAFADELSDASVHPPKKLPPPMVPAWQGNLATYVVGAQTKALTLYTAAYDKAKQLELYGDNMARIRKALSRLDPLKFPPEREARSPVRIGDRPVTVPFVETLRR